MGDGYNDGVWIEDTGKTNERMLSSGWGNVRCAKRNDCQVFL